MEKNLRTIMANSCTFLRSLFVNGLITVLPLLLTISVLNMLFRFITSLLAPIKNLITASSHFIPDWLQWIPHIEVIIAILLIFLLGTVLNILIFRSILAWFEQWFSKIPLIRPIYKGMKQLVKSFGQHDQTSFQQIVLVKFPHEHTHTVGFVTGQVPAKLAPKPDTIYMSVYVPTTPNPTGGFYLIIAQNDLIPLEMNRQEAMTLIMSLGMINPSQT